MRIIILLSLVAALTACSATRVVKNCRELSQGFYECEDP
jgi:hypothetical protein